MPVDMDLNLIRSFVEVVDARSLSEAARRREWLAEQAAALPGRDSVESQQGTEGA